MKSTFKASNITKRTPDFWRRLGNSALVMAAGAPLVINQFTFSPELKDNLGAAVALIGLVAKGVTTFFGEKK